VTEPVGKRGEQIVANVDQLLTDLNHLVRMINQKDGTMQQFIANPSLYNNLDRASQQLAILMKHLEPIVKDLREFGDKVARNPELLGVGGAVRPSKGLKDEEILDTKRTANPRDQKARGNNPK
jgi:phospholipid/cholesterol/gamma-HCH transport system substrate-binding protein